MFNFEEYNLQFLAPPPASHQQLVYDDRRPITHTGNNAPTDRIRPVVSLPTRGMLRNSAADISQGQRRRTAQFADQSTQSGNTKHGGPSSQPEAARFRNQPDHSAQSGNAQFREQPRDHYSAPQLNNRQFQKNFQQNNYYQQEAASVEHCEQVASALKRKYHKLAERLQNAEDTGNYSHISGSNTCIRN